MTLLDLNPDQFGQPSAPVEDDDPQPPAPDWDAVTLHLSALAEVEEQYNAAMVEFRIADGPTDRTRAVWAAPAARMRHAADRSCALDAADLAEWGRWAQRHIARLDRRLAAAYADLETAQRERHALTVRTAQAETLTVAAGAARPNPDGGGLLPVARHANDGEVAA